MVSTRWHSHKGADSGGSLAFISLLKDKQQLRKKHTPKTPNTWIDVGLAPHSPANWFSEITQAGTGWLPPMCSTAETDWISEPKKVIGKLSHLPLKLRTIPVSKTNMEKLWPTHFEGLVFKELLHMPYLEPPWPAKWILLLSPF